MSDITLRQARRDYFQCNGFPADGGYDEKWVPLKFGKLTISLYNAKSRREAVPLHDLHHIVTGYKTDPIGEAEIATLELAAGTHSKYFATLINLLAVIYGAVLSPRRMFRAYVLGRNSSTFYNRNITESLLETSVIEARAELLPEQAPSPTAANYLGFIMLFLFSLGLFSWPILIFLLTQQ